MDRNFWSTFCATGPLRFIVLTFVIFAKLSSCVTLPWPRPVPARAGHVSTPGDGHPRPTGKRAEGPPRVYTRAELLSIRPARLSADLAGTLRSLDIGFRLPRKRNKRKNSTQKLKVAVFNAQSARNIASDIHEIIVDNKLDILMITETWLKPEGDEYTISTMTPTGYVCRSFPRGARGYGGIAFVLRSNLEATFTLFSPAPKPEPQAPLTFYHERLSIYSCAVLTHPCNSILSHDSGLGAGLRTGDPHMTIFICDSEFTKKK